MAPGVFIKVLAVLALTAGAALAQGAPVYEVERGQARDLPLEAVFQNPDTATTLAEVDEGILTQAFRSNFDMAECIRRRESNYRMRGDRFALENGFARQMCQSDRRRAGGTPDVTPCFHPFTPVNSSAVMRRMTPATRKTAAFFHSMGVPADQAFAFFTFQLGPYTDLIAARYLAEVGTLPQGLADAQFDARGKVIGDDFGQASAALRLLTVGVPDYLVIVVGLEGYGGGLSTNRRICAPEEL